MCWGVGVAMGLGWGVLAGEVAIGPCAGLVAGARAAELAAQLAGGVGALLGGVAALWSFWDPGPGAGEVRSRRAFALLWGALLFFVPPAALLAVGSWHELGLGPARDPVTSALAAIAAGLAALLGLGLGAANELTWREREARGAPGS